MLIIDAQVDAYERNHPARPWHKILTGPDEVTGDQMVTAMDAVGVDGAILVSPFTMYRYDASYALEVKKRHPGRFALVKAVDPTNPAVADVIAEWKRVLDAVAVRMLLVRGGYAEDAADPGLNRVLAEAARLSLPVNLHIAGRLDQGIELIRRHPDTQIIVDHLGLVQPHAPPVAGGAVGRFAEGADAGQTAARRHQDQRRLHAVA
jgi:L-fuconolactonase